MRAQLIKEKGIVAIWTEKDKAIIGVEKDEDTLRVIKPVAVEGKKTEFRVVGEIKVIPPIKPLDLARTDKWRPAPPGVSIGHRDITAGTLGMIYKLNGEIVILSNNHVFANCNAGIKGDPVYQPGPYDIDGPDPPVPCPFANFVAKMMNIPARILRSSWRLKAYQPKIDEEYHLANLWDFHPIDFVGHHNYIDAAIAVPLDPTWVKNEILELGFATGFGKAKIGMNVIKSGRTTAISRGSVTAVDGLIQVGYPNNKQAVFANQIITPNMMSGGDSGSNFLEESSMKVVGLGFAGSDTLSVVNPIEYVLKKWELEII